MYDKLISDLRDYAGWAEANSYEVPVDMPDLLREAADTIEKIGREERSKVITNADHIRCMTDEEITVFLNEWAERPLSWKCDPGETEYWLKQPYKEADNE